MLLVLTACSKRETVSYQEKNLVPSSSYAMLIVESESCIYCKQLDKDLKTDPLLIKSLQGIDVFKVTAESNAPVVYKLSGKEGKTTEEDLVRALGVRAFPYIVFYNREGDILLQLPGYVPPKTLACVVEYIKEGEYRKTDVNQYLRQRNCLS